MDTARRQFKVSANESGQRLDKWLVSKLSVLSRKKVKELIDNGRVFVNGKGIIIAGWEVKEGDFVEVRAEGAKGKKQQHLKIYYEDRDIIVVEKPAGILSIGRRGETSLIGLVCQYVQRKYGRFGTVSSYVAPLHRLDTETSGVMAFALSKAGRLLEGQFHRHRVEREYVAIVSGCVERASGKISGPLEKGRFSGGRKVRSSTQGREAVTEYRVLERYRDATMLSVTLKTGRTHQIRAHFAAKGHPVIGDRVYSAGMGGTHKLPFRRHALHAAWLAFQHPTTGRDMKFRSPLPPDIRALIDRLREG